MMAVVCEVRATLQVWGSMLEMTEGVCNHPLEPVVANRNSFR